jgi:hypothetical protein
MLPGLSSEEGVILRRYLSLAPYIGLLFLILLLPSCSFFGDNITIINNSDYQVTFKFLKGNDNTHVLNPGKTEKYYAHSSSLSFYKSDPPRVAYKIINDSEGEFIDAIPIILETRNTLDFPVALSEKNNYMDLPTITISSGEIKLTGNVYSKTPNFIVSPLAKVDFVINTEKNIMYVTIH